MEGKGGTARSDIHSLWLEIKHRSIFFTYQSMRSHLVGIIQFIVCNVFVARILNSFSLTIALKIDWIERLKSNIDSYSLS